MTAAALLSVQAQPVTTTPVPERRSLSSEVDARWKSSFDAFSKADQAKAPAAGGVLFVGSSSIRLWNDLETSFEKQPVVIKRGFGGSTLSDCARYLDLLVLPYKPSLVVVYAGDNDLAEGATPLQVLDSFTAFVRGVRAQLPNTRIAFLSIKPSPLRETLMASAREANRLIESYSLSQENIDYIDVYSKMLGPDGRPRADLYGTDSLHLNEAGYAVWKREISAHLKP